MNCVRHFPPSSTCNACRATAVNALLRKLLWLGPRTETEFAALLQTARQTTPWVTRSTCGKFVSTLPNGTIAHQLYVLVHSIARLHLSPVEAKSVVPPDMWTAFADYVSSRQASAIVNVFTTDRGVMMVRARSTHSAHNMLTLADALRRAGALGITRCTVAAEYEHAYTDLETLTKTSVFATSQHAWHRDVAMPRTPGVLERAQALGFVRI